MTEPAAGEKTRDIVLGLLDELHLRSSAPSAVELRMVDGRIADCRLPLWLCLSKMKGEQVKDLLPLLAISQRVLPRFTISLRAASRRARSCNVRLWKPDFAILSSSASI